jgi:hypothetical protein
LTFEIPQTFSMGCGSRPAQLFLGGFAALAVDDVCVVDLWEVDLWDVDACDVDLCAVVVFPFVFVLLAWAVAGFDAASFDCRASSSCACFSTAAALSGSVLVVMPPLVPWAYAPAVARDIRRIKLGLLKMRLTGCWRVRCCP